MDKCKEKVWPSGAWHSSPCARNATRDGYCAQHHPEAVKARRDASRAKFDAQYAKQAIAAQRARLASEFAEECAKWLGEGTAPLTADALYTGEGPEDQTFGDVARSILAPVRS